MFGFAAALRSKMSSTKKIITSRRVAAAIAFTGAIVFSVVLLSWPNLRNYRQSAFVESALNGNVRWMKLLLAVGADASEFECQTVRCRTPLIAAAQAGQYEAVQRLIARGADVNKTMKRGQTSFDVCLLLWSYRTGELVVSERG